MSIKATSDQSAFITDLVLAKFRSFAEFKKWLAASGIVRTNGQIFKQSMSLVQITNRITTLQASAIITEIQTLEDVEYKESYEPGQIDEVSELLEELRGEIESWTF